jgi:hypothetical protein
MSQMDFRNSFYTISANTAGISNGRQSSELRCKMKVEEFAEKPRATAQNKCAHPACRCPAEPGSKYCSTYCHDSGSKMEIACNCGHAACAEPAAGAA